VQCIKNTNSTVNANYNLVTYVPIHVSTLIGSSSGVVIYTFLLLNFRACIHIYIHRPKGDGMLFIICACYSWEMMLNIGPDLSGTKYCLTDDESLCLTVISLVILRFTVRDLDEVYSLLCIHFGITKHFLRKRSNTI
jgi:hypothetical protein